MLVDYKTSLAYICPYCSSVNLRIIDPFDFSGRSVLEVKCAGDACGETVVRITDAKDKYKLAVECPLCEETHRAEIKKNTFWSQNLFQLTCSESGMPVMCIGEKDEASGVIRDLAHKLIAFDEMMGASDDIRLFMEIAERVNLLAKTGKVSCVCGCKDIVMELFSKAVVLTCRDCAREKHIPPTQESLTELLNASAIVLD